MIKKIIFIVIDTLRAKNVGLYGANPSPTPNIDQLGKDSIIFTNAYTTITKTDPSISSIMTGKYPISLGIVNHGKSVSHVEEENVEKALFLAEVLKANGYETFAVDWIGKWHKRGYDYYSGRIDKDSDSVNFTLRKLPLLFYLKSFDKIMLKLSQRSFFVRFYYCFLPNPKIPYDTANNIVDKAIFLLKKNSKKKLFLYLHFWDPHFPHIRPKKFKSYLLDTVADTYNAEVSFLDQEIGRLLAYVREQKENDNTLIILTSDHGENFSEYGNPLNHEFLYENVVKIPLLIRNPYLHARKIDALAQHIDIFPTILQMLNIPITKDIEGKSLLPLIKGIKKQVRDFVYFEDVLHRRFYFTKNRRRRGLRVGNYKYIETLSQYNNPMVPSELTKISSQELYYLKNDPEEEKNIRKQNSVIVNALRKKLLDFINYLNIKRMQNNPALKSKVEKSLRTITKAAKQYKNDEIAIAWTGGKDSTTLLHLVRMAFNRKIPFKVIFNDSTMEFEEIYEFIDKVSKLWNIKLITIKHSEKELREFHATKDHERKKELSRLMKITAINRALKKYKLKAFMAAIRWDEHESRSKEKYFSPRSDHMRIHPLLHFTENDIWEYIRHFGVPYVELYDKGYRSLGEKPFTKPVPPGGSERSGREREKEQLMERLRKMGYW